MVYAGIHLRAPATALSTTYGWPAGVTRGALDEYYTRVEAKLSVVANPGGAYYSPVGTNRGSALTDPIRAGYPIEGTGSFPRAAQFAAGARLKGWTPQPLPLAIKDCSFCGWCVPHCVYGAKQTMWDTYLRRALATGRLRIFTRRKAIMITKPTQSTYRVHFWDTTVRSDNYHRVNNNGDTGLDNTITADAARVVVACGPLESPPLLWRSLNRPLPAGTTRITPFQTTSLGNGIDGQGDSAAGGLLPSGKETLTYRGAIMMAYVDRGPYIITDVHAFPVAPGVKYQASFPSVTGGPFGERLYGLGYKQKWRTFGTNMLGLGVIGKSGGNTANNMSIRDGSGSNAGNAVLSTTAYAPPDNGLADARSIITALGGELANTPWERYNANSPQQIGTVHPTGGCRMGSSSDSVVDKNRLEVYNNTSLHVIDGSVFPASCWRNPSHTIAAIAEHAMDMILGVVGAPAW
jgi:cholesterol oxidase